MKINTIIYKLTNREVRKCLLLRTNREELIDCYNLYLEDDISKSKFRGLELFLLEFDELVGEGYKHNIEGVVYDVERIVTDEVLIDTPNTTQFYPYDKNEFKQNIIQNPRGGLSVAPPKTSTPKIEKPTNTVGPPMPQVFKY